MKKRNSNLFQNLPIVWVIPAVLILVFAFIIPVIDVVRMSFTNQKIAQPDYIYTLKTYFKVFAEPSFAQMLSKTTVFVLFSVSFQVLLGLLIALAVDQGERLKMRGTVFVRTVSLVSMVIPGVIIGIIWRLMFMESSNGILNYLFSQVGIQNIQFLSDPNMAMVSAVIANVWRGTASSMILLYAAIKTIPNELIEASMVDGANAIQRLFRIKLPVISGLMLIVVIINIIGTFNTFDMIMSLTGGGPGRATEVLALSAYRRVFSELNISKGSAIAVILLIINMVMAFGYFRMKERVER